MTRYYVYCMKWKIAGAILSMFLLIVSSKFVHAQHVWWSRKIGQQNNKMLLC